MFPGRAVDAAGTVGGGAAPDALVGAMAVAVLPRRRVDATRTVARAAAMSAFGAHGGSFNIGIIAYFPLACSTPPFTPITST